MRIRHKPWAKPELENCSFYVCAPKENAGHWKEAFSKEQPLRLELGCGKGGFIAQEASAHPEYNYIAIDIKNEMLVLAKRKLEQTYAEKNLPLENIRIFICNLMLFSEYFTPADRVDRMYINFCNPWPRPKHKKRRLTHLRQLLQYKTVLDGEIWFKTDDDLLFKESIPYFEEAGFEIIFQTQNLHLEKGIESFQTEHEKMFDDMGKTIKFLIAKPIVQNSVKKGSCEHGI